MPITSGAVGRFPSSLSVIRHRLRRGTRCVLRVVLLFLPVIVSCRVPGAVRPTVKVGLVAPFEGRYRYVGYDVVYAVNLALLEANEAGGVGGYGVELVAYDDGANPSVAVEQVRKLDVDPDVVGAIGHFREDTTAAAAETYVRMGIPLIASGVLTPDLAGEGEWVVRLGPTAGPLAEALLDRAVGLAPVHDLTVVGQGGPLEEALRLAMRERTGEALDVVSAGQEGWDGEVMARAPEVIVLDLDPVRAGEVVAGLREHGWSGEFLGGPALAPSDFVSVAGEAAAGAAFVTPWPFPSDLPGGDEFALAYREVSNGVEPGPLARPAYEAAWTLVEALERAAADGEPTRERVAGVLSNAERRGPLGRLTVGEARDWAELGLYWYRIGSDGVPDLER